MSVYTTCLIAGCNKPIFARGWCGSHYKRWWRHGNPLLGTAQNYAGENFIRDIAIVFKGEECLIWPYGKRHGYGYINTYEGSHCKTNVHQIVCQVVHGPPPSSKHEVAHNCGNGHIGCCNPNHLRWDTSKGNLADRILHGTLPRGETHGHAKLTENDVRRIRLLSLYRRSCEIALEFNTCKSNIYSIVKRRRWSHVQ